MKFFRWLNRKLQPSAVAMSGRPAPVASEIRKEEEEQQVEKP